jgi:sensor histidine kinase YesM
MYKLLQSRRNGFNLTDFMIFRNRWWQHPVFWAGVFLILLTIFKTSGSVQRIDVVYTLIFLVPLVTVTYLNLYHFIPRYLRRERYLLYVLFFPILMATGALLLYFIFDRWIDLILPGYYFISYYSVAQLMIFTGSVMLLTTLLKLSRSWFMLLRMERMTTRQQLKSLQSQINPHFLLNSLQTIYALSLENSVNTPDAILRLSEILKYTLYETEQPRIPLAQEIRMIRDYVEMYRYRVDPVRAEILLEVEGEPGEMQIAPMLLIPFIENSFKHGLQAGPGNAFVHIHLLAGNGNMEFNIRNNLGKADPSGPDTGKGIGIENTRQRLDLLYPGKHMLKIRKEEGTFTVSLKIQTEP